MSSPKLPLYLDNASTTKVDKRVLEEMLPYFTELFGNASSSHSYGKVAKHAIEKARSQVSDLINANDNEILFTSGATEAINLGIKGYAEANSHKGNHIITVKTEHKAVLATCEYLESKGYEVTYLNVDKNGLISLDQLRSSILDNTILIVVMYVNNEIGIIQPIREIGLMAKEYEITFFCDATQAVGKVHIDVEKDNIDMLCLSGHKLNGPKGIGALFMRRNIEITPLIHGGGQEKGLRGGTYNTPLIVGLGKACQLALIEFESNIFNLISKRKRLENYYEKNNLGLINFKESPRAPHILSITLYDYEAEEFLMIKSKEFVASTGSACNSEIMEISHVLKELDFNQNNNIIRISF
ncbi:cysteine desulfurase family protein [Mangrovimonas sp. TPBH4]|uniref:cysteine desulfurase family protein n=1 Tax=Mangrovimonas sp. TPBH4 TaxID=1645914 RepID=UPI0006B5B329|nr:cysteine desulfurase family protein [Mangrovimonas sp. TPBH4]